MYNYHLAHRSPALLSRLDWYCFGYDIGCYIENNILVWHHRVSSAHPLPQIYVDAKIAAGRECSMAFRERFSVQSNKTRSSCIALGMLNTRFTKDLRYKTHIPIGVIQCSLIPVVNIGRFELVLSRWWLQPKNRFRIWVLVTRAIF